jgi:hypothetical protein
MKTQKRINPIQTRKEEKDLLKCALYNAIVYDRLEKVKNINNSTTLNDIIEAYKPIPIDEIRYGRKRKTLTIRDERFVNGFTLAKYGIIIL